MGFYVVKMRKSEYEKAVNVMDVLSAFGGELERGTNLKSKLENPKTHRVAGQEAF